jgi:DNA-binding response OmpR family regulator
MDVLLVEDDPRIARVVERALTDVGHRVQVAHDGLEGLTSAERGTHDLVVLDVMLP